MHDLKLGRPDGWPVVFGHGWARDHRDFIPTAESLTNFAHSYLLDFPGFGKSPRPEGNWGAAEYADHVAAYLKREVGRPVIWVGHSFGGRVGIQLAVRHAASVKAMVLVGSAGIPTKRSLYARWRSRARQAQFKALRARARTQDEKDALERKFGSLDYIASKRLGIRDIFVKIVNEDQSAALPAVSVPTHFMYGGRDNETPPALGQRMAELVRGSTLEVLPEFNHLTILSRGYHVIAKRVKELST